MNKTVTLQRQARQLWRAGQFSEASKLYLKAADSCKGFARHVNLRCAADCESRRPFNGTPQE